MSWLKNRIHLIMLMFHAHLRGMRSAAPNCIVTQETISFCAVEMSYLIMKTGGFVLMNQAGTGPDLCKWTLPSLEVCPLAIGLLTSSKQTDWKHDERSQVLVATVEKLCPEMSFWSIFNHQAAKIHPPDRATVHFSSRCRCLIMRWRMKSSLAPELADSPPFF